MRTSLLGLTTLNSFWRNYRETKRLELWARLILKKTGILRRIALKARCPYMAPASSSGVNVLLISVATVRTQLVELTGLQLLPPACGVGRRGIIRNGAFITID